MFQLMVITHRRRLVEALHVPLREALPCLVAQVEGALRGGADLVYLREPDLSVREVMSVVTAVLDRLPDAHHRLVVRDRVDVAASLGVGVHLPEQGMAVGPARVQLERGTAPVVVGRSVHTALSAANSRGARYLVAGTVKPTDSKPGLTQPLGLHGLREICTAAEGIPVLGVGGLGTEDIEDLRRSGAQGLAAIGLFIPIRICTDVTAWTIERLKDVRKCIDLVE